MKKIILSLAIATTILTSCKENKKDKVVVENEVKIEETKALNNVDVFNSVIYWKGTKPTGAHNGVIMLKESSLIFEKGALKGGEFIIDMSSIKVLDIPADKKGNADLVGHLSNSDFFDIATYPTSKFVITNVENKQNKLHVTGNLTLKNVTKSITIPVILDIQEDVINFKSEVFSVDRTDFGITYKSKKIDAALKDKFINDLMEISIDIKTKK